MSEPIVESLAPIETQEAAEKLGWIPPARFKGDPEKFIDADLYIERGETVLPIVKEQNKRLHGEVESLRAQSAQMSAALAKAQDAIDQLHSVEVVRAAEKARNDLKLQLAEASENNDHIGVAELTDQLVRMNAEQPPVVKPAPAPAAPKPFVPDPDLLAWQEEHTWFGKDKAKTGMALGIGQTLREEGEKAVGRAFYDKIIERMDELFGVEKAAPVSKVEGARNGGDDRQPASRGGKTYAALPKEAKDQCAADAKNFVGPGKRYKSVAEWQTRYAEIYFE
jgi:hypothetical protein